MNDNLGSGEEASNMWYFGKTAWASVWLCLIGCLIVGCGVKQIPPDVALSSSQPGDLVMQEITYRTSDGVAISGSWVLPQAQKNTVSKRPVVLLLHDYGIDRRDWGIFIPELVQRGYNVLAIDLRGHGQSKGAGLRASDTQSSSLVSYVIETGYRDVESALKWITSQKDADEKHIFLIGVGLGADIAYLCSGIFPKNIQATVAISPSIELLTEGRFVDIEPHAILFCATSQSKQGNTMLTVESLANFTKPPTKVAIYKSAAHGFAMFYKHPEMKQDILEWIKP